MDKLELIYYFIFIIYSLNAIICPEAHCDAMGSHICVFCFITTWSWSIRKGLLICIHLYRVFRSRICSFVEIVSTNTWVQVVWTNFSSFSHCEALSIVFSSNIILTNSWSSSINERLRLYRNWKSSPWFMSIYVIRSDAWSIVWSLWVISRPNSKAWCLVGWFIGIVWSRWDISSWNFGNVPSPNWEFWLLFLSYRFFYIICAHTWCFEWINDPRGHCG